MTGHLPECPWADRGYAFPCICDRLRSCEQRVSKEALQDAKARESNGITWAQAYSAALDAAREAVEQASTLFEPLGPALAAIDALRGES